MYKTGSGKVCSPSVVADLILIPVAEIGFSFSLLRQ